MRKTLVYDLPTRLFHLLFATLFLASFVIAKTVDDESVIFSYHMLSGLLLSVLVLWRVLWGFLGSTYARWSSFSLHPRELTDYMLGFVHQSQRRWSGHNPASSWSALLMLVLAALLALTGFLMTTGSKEAFEDIHELFANSFIVVVVLHVAGVILHTLRHRDGIAMSMIDGKKSVESTAHESVSTRPLAAVVFIALVALSSVYLFKNFSSQTGRLNLFGQSLQLREISDSQIQTGEEEDEYDDI